LSILSSQMSISWDPFPRNSSIVISILAAGCGWIVTVVGEDISSGVAVVGVVVDVGGLAVVDAAPLKVGNKLVRDLLIVSNKANASVKSSSVMLENELLMTVVGACVDEGLDARAGVLEVADRLA